VHVRVVVANAASREWSAQVESRSAAALNGDLIAFCGNVSVRHVRADRRKIVAKSSPRATAWCATMRKYAGRGRDIAIKQSAVAVVVGVADGSPPVDTWALRLVWSTRPSA